jgi:hypothetical protein
MIKSRRIKWAGHVERIGGKRSIYSVLAEKAVGKRPLGRHRLKLEDNIKMGVREIGWVVMEGTHLAHDMDQWRALVNTAMNLWVL